MTVIDLDRSQQASVHELPDIGVADIENERPGRAQGGDDIVIFVGGVIPAQDYDELYKAGAAGIFGPGTPIPQCAREVLRAIRAAHLPGSA